MALAKRIGILGGGQLARLLALEAHRLGHNPYILCPEANEPAAQVCRNWIQGSANNLEDLTSFLQFIDVLTFESEFFDPGLIEQALRKSKAGVFPSVSNLGIFQDRRTQKEALDTHHIPTAKYVCVSTLSDLAGLWPLFNGEFLLKKAQGGYDGYGTFSIRQAADLHGHQSEWRGPYIAEQKIGFQKELAAVLFRSHKGELQHLPLVESIQINAKCDHVIGPESHPQWSELREKIFLMMKKMDYVGSLAVEMFETPKGLLVNELAPRVHNTGHYSQEAMTRSQFELHLRAGLGESLEVKMRDIKSFVMVNLLGDGKNHFDLSRTGSGFLHWYGKSENRLGRKLGHINFIGHERSEILDLALKTRMQMRKA